MKAYYEVEFAESHIQILYRLKLVYISPAEDENCCFEQCGESKWPHAHLQISTNTNLHKNTVFCIKCQAKLRFYSLFCNNGVAKLQ